MFTHWKVIKRPDTTYPSLVAVRDGELHPFGNPTYSMDDGRYETLKTFEIYIEDEDWFGFEKTDDYLEKEQKLIDNFYIEFCPEPVKNLFESAGWLSPDGKFFSCDYAGHYNLSEFLVAKYIESGLHNTEKALENAGWIKIHQDGTVLDYKVDRPTKKQLDTLGELELASSSSGYKQRINRSLSLYLV